MQDLILLLASVLFLAAGVLSPFIMSLGYLWVDIFTPQNVSASILSGQPIAFLFGASAIGVYLLRDRRRRPKFNAIIVLQILLLIWITLTTQWAVAPVQAAGRYDLYSKVCVFAIFLPFVIRSRVQIEAMVLVYIFSIYAHLLPWGLKTFVTGGGYNQSLGLLRVNSVTLAESSAVSAIAVAVVPLLLSMRAHSLLLPNNWLRTIGITGLIGVGLVGSIGTFARTALIAFGIGGTAMWLRSRRKVLFLIGALAMGGLMFSVTSDKWTQRISTVADYQTENSAYVRILVWQWAWSFVQSHPLGGGFFAYTTNRIEIPTEGGGAPMVQYGRAYHNIYFSLLGDQGYPGFILYMSMVVAVLWGLQTTRKLTLKLPEHVWCADLAQATQIAVLIMLSGGMFVEIGWTPIVWYLFSLAACLREYARRVTAEPQPSLMSARARAPTSVANPPVSAPVAGALLPGGRVRDPVPTFRM